MENLSFGPVPYDEPCQQLGETYEPDLARKECRTFLNQLIREFGEPPEQAKLFIQSNPHDFGSYLTVDVKFNELDRAASDYAYMIDAKVPANWDDESRKELGL